MGRLMISEALIESNADISIKDKTGKTALDYAYAAKDYGIILKIANKSIQEKLKNITDYNLTSTFSGLTSNIKFNYQALKTSYTKNTVNEKADVNITITIGNIDFTGKIIIIQKGDFESSSYNMEFDITGNNKRLSGNIVRKYSSFDNVLYTDNINLIFNNIKLEGNIIEARFVRYKNFNLNYGQDKITGDIINKDFDEYYYYDIKFGDKYFIRKKGMLSSQGMNISTNISDYEFFIYFLIEQYDQLIKNMEDARKKKMEEIRNKK